MGPEPLSSGKHQSIRGAIKRIAKLQWGRSRLAPENATVSGQMTGLLNQLQWGRSRLAPENSLQEAMNFCPRELLQWGRSRLAPENQGHARPGQHHPGRFNGAGAA